MSKVYSKSITLKRFLTTMPFIGLFLAFVNDVNANIIINTQNEPSITSIVGEIQSQLPLLAFGVVWIMSFSYVALRLFEGGDRGKAFLHGLALQLTGVMAYLSVYFIVGSPVVLLVYI